MLPSLRPTWIDSEDGVRGVVERCRDAGSFALDTEADSLHSYFHKVCLIQVSAGDDHMVIDPLAIEAASLEALWELVGDPSIPVLMHGADYDLRILDRDFGARVRGLRDTQIMAQLLGMEKTGLAVLLACELSVDLDKRFQRANWGRRPLTDDQVNYAGADTAYLEALAARLRVRLEDLGRWAWAEEEFRKLETVQHKPAVADPFEFERIKGGRSLRGKARDRLFSVWTWREERAQELDVPPFKILGNRTLIELAQRAPGTRDDLGTIDGIGPRAVRRWGGEILGNLRRPAAAPAWIPKPRTVAPDPNVRRRLRRLLAARDQIAAELALPGGLVCARACAEAIAVREPGCHSPRDLVLAGLDGWRLKVLGVAFLEAIAAD